MCVGRRGNGKINKKNKIIMHTLRQELTRGKNLVPSQEIGKKKVVQMFKDQINVNFWLIDSCHFEH